jgi:integrase
VLVLAAVHAARAGAIRAAQLDDVDLGNRRLTIAGRVRPIDELTHQILLDWLDYRRTRSARRSRIAGSGGLGWWTARWLRKVIMRVQNCSVARASACALPPIPATKVVAKNGKFGGKPKK